MAKPGRHPNGNILHELDKQSIVRHGDVVTFRDRKTIFNLKRGNLHQPAAPQGVGQQLAD